MYKISTNFHGLNKECAIDIVTKSIGVLTGLIRDRGKSFRVAYLPISNILLMHVLQGNVMQ